VKKYKFNLIIYFEAKKAYLLDAFFDPASNTCLRPSVPSKMASSAAAEGLSRPDNLIIKRKA